MGSPDYLTAVLALAFVLGLVALLGWVVRRLGLIPGAAAFKKRGKRLEIVEMTALDVRRKLVLVRRDNVEHLILLGLQRDVVVETGITPPAAAEKASDA
jgi:flagellar protein FliO/FliZ